MGAGGACTAAICAGFMPCIRSLSEPCDTAIVNPRISVAALLHRP
jgi:hypothetical protein